MLLTMTTHALREHSYLRKSDKRSCIHIEISFANSMLFLPSFTPSTSFSSVASPPLVDISRQKVAPTPYLMTVPSFRFRSPSYPISMYTRVIKVNYSSETRCSRRGFVFRILVPVGKIRSDSMGNKFSTINFSSAREPNVAETTRQY